MREAVQSKRNKVVKITREVNVADSLACVSTAKTPREHNDTHQLRCDYQGQRLVRLSPPH